MTAADVLSNAMTYLTSASRDRFGAMYSVTQMTDRMPERSRRNEAMLAGIAMAPLARKELRRLLEAYWREDSLARMQPVTGVLAVPASTPAFTAGEVIAGGGPHTAIYCAARVAAGFPKPLVICQDMPGGVFGMSENPSFWLNSGNRPGGPGLPGSGRELNYLPMAPVQPSMLSAESWQSNVPVAFITRVMLAMHADVIANAPVTGMDLPGPDNEDGPVTVRLMTSDGTPMSILAGRLINATGLGAERGAAKANGTSILTFTQLMKRADAPFPLRGIGRAAIMGGGPSALCAAEMLLGLGPQNGLSPAGLDYVPSVDIYSRSLPRTCQSWRSAIRGRYLPLGGFLPDPSASPARASRLRVVPRRVTPVSTGAGVLAGEDTYDTVVLAQGWEPGLVFRVITSSCGIDPVLGLKRDGQQYYAIGAAAGTDIRFSDAEEDAGLGRERGNKISLFRMASRTAALATALPAVSIPVI
jgi:hypothetical protein